MARYLLRRAAFAVMLVFLASSASLWLTRLAPGDFVTQSIGTTAAPGEAERMRARLGLDRSALQQYAHWLSRLARLDLGASFVDDRPVRSVVSERAFNTALLALVSLTVATLAGLSLGTLSGSRADSWFGTIVRHLSLALLSMPPLLISLVLIVVAAWTRWLPIGGMRSVTGPTDVLDLAWHMIVPVLALALPIAATFERLQAQAIQDTLRQPFLLATRARGVSRSRLLWRAALKPSLRSVASVYGIAAAALFSGSFVVEVVTAWPGLGRLTVEALRQRDLYVVAGCVATGSICLAIANLCADAALAALDPRSAE